MTSYRCVEFNVNVINLYEGTELMDDYYFWKVGEFEYCMPKTHADGIRAIVKELLKQELKKPRTRKRRKKATKKDTNVSSKDVLTK